MTHAEIPKSFFVRITVFLPILLIMGRVSYVLATFLYIAVLSLIRVSITGTLGSIVCNDHPHNGDLFRLKFRRQIWRTVLTVIDVLPAVFVPFALTKDLVVAL